MDLDYSEVGVVELFMESNMKDILKEFPEPIVNMSNICASNHLLRVDPNRKKLDKRCAEIFQWYVAKLIFISKRGHPDIHTAIDFLMARAQPQYMRTIGRSWFDLCSF